MKSVPFRARFGTPPCLSEQEGTAMKFTYSGSEMSESVKPEVPPLAALAADERAMSGNPCAAAVRWIWNSTLVRLILLVAVSIFVLTRFMGGVMSQILIGTLMLSVQAAVVELIMGAVRRKNLQQPGSGNERACRKRRWNWVSWFVAFSVWTVGTVLWLQYYRLLFNA